jgi:tetratricopeptide (TPR) repeat protein
VSFGFLNDLQSEYQRADELLSTAMQQIESTGSWFELLRASWFHGMVLANLGRLGDALRTLTKAMELAELNGETFWYSRYPNTIGWIYGEMADHESSLRLNTEGVRAGIIGGTPESEANAHINLVNTYVALGDLTHASEHLTEGASIVERDNHKHWLRWRFRIRLELAQSNYALAVGDFTGARKAAESALLRAEGVLARKHAADARRLLGEAAVGDKRLTEAASHYDAGLGILRKYPCPMIEWRLLRAASALAQITGGEKRSEHLLARSNEVVYSLRHKPKTSNQTVA